MRPFKGLWVLLVGLGFLLIGGAFANGAADVVASENADVSDDCEMAQASSQHSDGATHQETGLAGSGTLQTDDPCLNCHTDQERLQTLAVEEEVESLSEGPG